MLDLSNKEIKEMRKNPGPIALKIFDRVWGKKSY
jgi:hypothetical protein